MHKTFTFNYQNDFCGTLQIIFYETVAGMLHKSQLLIAISVLSTLHLFFKSLIVADSNKAQYKLPLKGLK